MEIHFHSTATSAFQTASAYRNNSGTSFAGSESNHNNAATSIKQVTSGSGLFQSYGSTVRHADWIHSLPVTEQHAARSLNRLSQAPVPIAAATHRARPAGSKSQTLLALAQLSTATVPALAELRYASTTVAANTNDHMSPQPMTVAASGSPVTNALAIAVTTAPVTTPPPSSRNSKLGPDTIADRHIPNHIITVLLDKKYPARFRHRLDDLFRTAEISPEVKNTPVEQRNARLLIQCLTLTIAAVSAHAKTMGFDNDYHFFHVALRDFWNIAQRLSAPHSKSAIEHYQTLLRRNKWQGHAVVIEQKFSDTDIAANIVSDYINFDYVEWGRHGLNYDTDVMFHIPNTARRFSLAQILYKEHLLFIAEHTVFCHFQFDNSGLPDNDLLDFVTVAGSEQFEIFRRASPAFLPDGYYQIDATRLLQAHLQQIQHTPLGFRKQEKIQEIININAVPLSLRPSLHRGKRELNIALTNLALEQAGYDLLGYSAIVYANSLLSGIAPRTFKELKNEDVVYADYIYSYEDADGRTRYDTTTLAEFLSQGVGSLFIDIGHRKNIQVLWPKEFDQDLIAYLINSIKLVNDFSRNLLLARDLADIRNDLKIEMPAFSSKLKIIFAKICRQADIQDASLADLFTFLYQAQTYNAEMQAGLQYKYPPLKMQFTAGQILLGAQRKWRSRNYNYNTEILAHAPRHILAGKASGYVKSLQDFPTQTRMTQELSQLKRHPFLKNHYQKYVSLLSSRVHKKNTWRYEFAETPLMAIYLHAPTPISNANGQTLYPLPWQLHFSLSLATSMTVLSIPSGAVHHFKSLSDMQQKLKKNPPLWEHFKSHFPVDYDDNLDALALIRMPPDEALYERLIDWEIKNIDKIIESHTEANAFEILERLSNVSFILALPAIVLGPGMSFAVDTFLSTGPKIIQAASSDTRQERNRLIKDIVIELSISTLSGITSEMISKGVTVGLKRLLRSSNIQITTTLKALDSADSIFRSLDRNNQFHCRTSGLNKKGSALCWFSKKTAESGLLKTNTKPSDIRFMEPLRKIPLHTSTDLPGSVSSYLNDLLAKREITAMLINPAGRCMDVVDPVTRFLLAQDHHMKISYRAILIWDKLLDAYIPSPINHFVVIFEKQGQRFVIDLTAGQFANRGMPTLNQALLLPEPAWIKAYQAASTSKLMKYKDFNEWLTAKNYFGGISVVHDGTSYLDGAILLSVPRKLESSVTRYV